MGSIVIIGGGAAGLMAAEAAVRTGVGVEVYDSMPSVGRKFLLAGKGGLNLTHSEPMDSFLSRYGTRRAFIEPAITAFPPTALRAWAHELGVETFVGSSGRIFPVDMNAAPLLRAWLRRLRLNGVRFHVRHRWCGWDEQGRLRFLTADGISLVQADAVVLALGGGSWPQLGSDAGWVKILSERHVPIAPLQPANCGFDVRWSQHFRARFAGYPVKTVALVSNALDGSTIRHMGEFVVTANGVEGGIIYIVSATVRDVITAEGLATLRLDLAPDRTLKQLVSDLSRPRGKRTVATHLKRCAGMTGVKAGLLREAVPREVLGDPVRLAAAIKALPLMLTAPRPIEEAISTAGGLSFTALDDSLMVRSLPGVFCAGEMLDWEAPTGGYLLTACLATGRLAGDKAAQWSKTQVGRSPCG
ncbi:putative Oxidoreductase with FAD/NAD(P)-binding domain [Candidatus Nitrospira nitrosa]|uniref:Putative Oxidoreductase with FAD/NAD(P)-binding domain n=1 Tax=Candidatus Nitrospira nitrosa TaxID=1742972 RepID=A0A0S4LNA9_9BACT|nr:TIGR03862 family flavoprotein [Candidatus Nitrospira nitrosa]CUS39073.1 putative Oxidoreductase with FAD/NAD(P)-binding domain [Candidatus Nitrospira nitrosa]